MVIKCFKKKSASSSTLWFKIISQTLAPKLDSFEIPCVKTLNNKLLSSKYSNQYAEKHEAIFNDESGSEKPGILSTFGYGFLWIHFWIYWNKNVEFQFSAYHSRNCKSLQTVSTCISNVFSNIIALGVG